jgi:hypothetical protein
MRNGDATAYADISLYYSGFSDFFVDSQIGDEEKEESLYFILEVKSKMSRRRLPPLPPIPGRRDEE